MRTGTQSENADSKKDQKPKFRICQMIPLSCDEALQKKSPDKGRCIKKKVIDKNIVAPNEFISLCLNKGMEIIEINTNPGENHDRQKKNRRELIVVKLFKI
jgi:hypothetical protein